MTDSKQCEEEEIFPCPICGRGFIRSSLIKHEQVCKKLQKMHRKVFDSGKQRSIGSDVPINDIRKAQKEKDKYGGTFPRPKTNWQQRHNDFINAVSVSKNVKEALKTGTPLPPPPRTSIQADYVYCNYCKRSFNSRAAEKHISFCKEQKLRRNSVNNQSNNSSTARSLSSSRSSTSIKSSTVTVPSHNNINNNCKIKEKQSNLTNQLLKSVPATSSSVFTTHASTKDNRVSTNRANLTNNNNKPQQQLNNNNTRTRSTSKSRNTSISGFFYDDKVDIDGIPLSTTNNNSPNLNHSKSNIITQNDKNKIRSNSQSRLKTPKQISGIRR